MCVRLLRSYTVGIRNIKQSHLSPFTHHTHSQPRIQDKCNTYYWLLSLLVSLDLISISCYTGCPILAVAILITAKNTLRDNDTLNIPRDVLAAFNSVGLHISVQLKTCSLKNIIIYRRICSTLFQSILHSDPVTTWNQSLHHNNNNNNNNILFSPRERGNTSKS